MSSYIHASNNYARYYHGEYQVPPSGFDTEEEQIVYLVGIQQGMLRRLTTLADAHDVLASALDKAIDRGVINPAEVPDTRDFVDLTGEWIAMQSRIAEGALDCLESESHISGVQVCFLDLAADEPRSRSDRLAAKVEELASQLFGRQLFGPS